MDNDDLPVGSVLTRREVLALFGTVRRRALGRVRAGRRDGIAAGGFDADLGRGSGLNDRLGDVRRGRAELRRKTGDDRGAVFRR